MYSFPMYDIIIKINYIPGFGTGDKYGPGKVGTGRKQSNSFVYY